MHIGNLRTALYAYLYAKRNNGTFMLRIEDTDRERYVEGAVDIIYSTLAAVGIEADEGPNEGGPYPPYIQSERKSMYLPYAEELIRLGGAYYCFCSKERLESLTDENGVRTYDKHCLRLPPEEVQARLKSGEPYVIRLNVDPDVVTEYTDMIYGRIAVEGKDLEDNILIKSDGMPTYNFANVIDDHTMNITHVIRGVEYLSSTPKYNLIYDAFGWERPKYIHLQHIMKDAQKKLSKRYGDANFDDFIRKGYLPGAIINYIALLGWSPKDNTEKLSMEQLIAEFSLEGISRSPSIFDEAKMRWLNAQYIRELPFEKFYRLSKPFIAESKAAEYDRELIARLLHGRCEVLSDIPGLINFVEEYELDPADFVNVKWKTDANLARDIAEKFLEGISSKELGVIEKDLLNNTFPVLSDWSEQSLNEYMISLGEKYGWKKGQVLWCIRIAVTGCQNTPGGAAEMLYLLGEKRSIARMKFFCNGR